MAFQWLLFSMLIVNCSPSLHEPDFNQENDYMPSWRYKCVPDKGCQRSHSPHLSNNATADKQYLYSNINLCRIVCGRFGGLWPKPVTAALGVQTLKIQPRFIRFDLVETPVNTRDLLESMGNLMVKNMLSECNGTVTEDPDRPVVVFVSVKGSGTTLHLGIAEHYMLDVQTRVSHIAIHIVADTVFGARHAMETLSHLVAADHYVMGEQQKCALHLVSDAKIRDKPVYKYRGFLLDTARNYFPMADIKRMIDGMAATKLNVFHWHISDTQSFPLESKRVPLITRYGAYSDAEIYTVEAVQDLVNYAKVRGVQVVMEIDAPAHAGNGWQWGPDYGYGDLAVCVNSKGWRQKCIQPPCGQLNPANPEMYRVLKDLYRDINEMLPKPNIFHVGGDEVFLPCWNSSQEIVSYMKSKGLNTDVEGFVSLWGEFHFKALAAWDSEYVATGGGQPPPVMIWSSELTQAERIEHYLDKNRYIIEVWEPLISPLLLKLIDLGYKVVSIPKDVWYLDRGFWGITTFSNWQRMYSYVLPSEPNVLGGEVAMWSEYVDSHVLDGRVWPRAAAVGERLWSDPITAPNQADSRLSIFRSRLIARGLKPDAMFPGWCAHNDALCH